MGMSQKLSWPIALAVLAVAVLLIAVVYRRAADSSSGARISPQFQQLSPAEQKAALENAERARRSRGAP